MDYSYRYDEMFLEADQMISNQQTKEALGLLLQIVEEQPDYGRAHNHLGWMYETKLKDFVKAEEHYNAALHFSPEYPAPWLNYAYFLGNLNRFEELEDHLARCMKVPGVFKGYVYNEYAGMYETQEDFPKAIEYYKMAIKKSFSQKDIEGYEESIERVKKKMEL